MDVSKLLRMIKPGAVQLKLPLVSTSSAVSEKGCCRVFASHGIGLPGLMSAAARQLTSSTGAAIASVKTVFSRVSRVWTAAGLAEADGVGVGDGMSVGETVGVGMGDSAIVGTGLGAIVCGCPPHPTSSRPSNGKKQCQLRFGRHI